MMDSILNTLTKNPPRTCVAIFFSVFLANTSLAQESMQIRENSYTVKPGDLLEISVWKEPDLTRDVLVRPDGGLSFPLAGEVLAGGKTIESVRGAIAEGLVRFIPDPVVTVSVKEIRGNQIYVIGEVKAPGEYIATRPTDVMQALSRAGGMTEFADRDDILILRRDERGSEQTALTFDYDEVASGKNLDQNIILRSGDILVVP